MPVLSHRSWETPVLLDLGFCCRKKDGVEGGNDGQLVKVFRQGGLCVLTLFYQRWRRPSISRGSGSSWKTGWTCASLSLSVCTEEVLRKPLVSPTTITCPAFLLRRPPCPCTSPHVPWVSGQAALCLPDGLDQDLFIFPISALWR